MLRGKPLQFSIISAQTLSDLLPPLLPILQYHKRNKSGPTVRVLATGDIAWSGGIQKSGETRGFEHLVGEIAPFLKTGDIVFGNLEVPIIRKSAEVKYAASPRYSSIMLDLGFDVLHVASSHIYDFGPAGLKNTLNELNRLSILALGANKDLKSAQSLVVTEKNGIKIGWLGCGRTLRTQKAMGPNYWEYNESELLRRIQEMRHQVDVLIVSVHIGYLYLDYPDPEHKMMSEKLIEAGANLVLMHHAHTLQGVHVPNPNSIVCYNLGNFWFDWKQGNIVETKSIELQRRGGVFLFDIDKDGVCFASILPTYVDEKYALHWSCGTEGEKTLERIVRISHETRGDYSQLFHDQRAQWHTVRTIKVLFINLVRGNFGYILATIRQTRVYHFKMVLKYVYKLLRRLPS